MHVLARELLAIDAARLGDWGALLNERKGPSSTIERALRGFARQWLTGRAASWRERCARRSLPPSERMALASRRAFQDPCDAHTRAVLAYTALVRGEPIGPRASLELLATLDQLLDATQPTCILGVEVRQDPALLAAIYDDVALALADPLCRSRAPLAHMEKLGPIALRVREHVEVLATTELERALKVVDERMKLGRRLSAADEWLEASRLSMLFSRVEESAGIGAAQRVYPRYQEVYWALGLWLMKQISPTSRPMRPLAHAIFRSLVTPVSRFSSRKGENLTILKSNLRITAGV